MQTGCKTHLYKSTDKLKGFVFPICTTCPGGKTYRTNGVHHPIVSGDDVDGEQVAQQDLHFLYRLACFMGHMFAQLSFAK